MAVTDVEAVAPPTPAGAISEAPCPQTIHQPKAEPHADCVAADADGPNTGNEGPGSKQVPSAPQVRTPGEQVAEPNNDAGPPQPAAVDERVHHDATTDTGLDARAPPATSSKTADAASGAPCPQATHLVEVEACASRAAEDTDRPGTKSGGRGAEQTTDAPPGTDRWGTD